MGDAELNHPANLLNRQDFKCLSFPDTKSGMICYKQWIINIAGNQVTLTLQLMLTCSQLTYSDKKTLPYSN